MKKAIKYGLQRLSYGCRYCSFENLSNKLKISVLLVFLLTLSLTANSYLNANALEDYLWNIRAYSWECSPETYTDTSETASRCKELRQSRMDFACMLAQMGFYFGGLITGFIFDAVGARISGVFGFMFFGVGMGLMSYTRHIATGLVIQGVSTQMTTNAVLSLTRYFKKHQYLVMGGVGAAVDTSLAAFPILLWLQNNVSLNNKNSVSLIPILFAVFGMLLAFVVLPEKTVCKNTQSTRDTHYSPIEEQNLICGKQKQEEIIIINSENENNVKTLLCNPLYWSFALYFSIIASQQSTYYISNKYILQKYGDTDKKYQSLFELLLPLGFPFSLLQGWIVDRFGMTFLIFIVNFMALGVNVICLVPSLQIQLLTFILFIAFSDDTYQLLCCFMKFSFGDAHFGTLVGVLNGVSGVVTLAMAYIHSSLRNRFNEYKHAHMCFIGVLTLNFFVVLFIRSLLSKQKPA